LLLSNGHDWEKDTSANGLSGVPVDILQRDIALLNCVGVTKFLPNSKKTSNSTIQMK